jgi:hypothetical protein
MDLTAIKGKVQQGRYLRYPGEFHDDAVLVFCVQLENCGGKEHKQPQLQAKSHEDMADLKLRCEAIWTTMKGELQSVVIDKDANAALSPSEHLIQLYRENLSVVTAYLEKLDQEVGYYNDSASGKRMRVEDESILLKAFWKDSIMGQCDTDSRAVDEDMICPTTQRLMVDPVKCRVDVEGDVFTCAYERSGIERWKQTQVELWKEKQSQEELKITCPMRPDRPLKTIFQDGEYKLVMVQDEEMLKRIKELQSEKMANEARRKQEIEGREEHIMMRRRLGYDDESDELADTIGSGSVIDKPQALLKRLHDGHNMCVMGPPASGKTLCMAQVACAAVQSVKSFIARRVLEKSSHATSNLDQQDQDARAEDDESTNTAPLMPIFVHAAKLSSFYRQRKPESSIKI